MYVGEFQFGQRQGYGELRISLDSQQNPNNRFRQNILDKSSKNLVELVLHEWDVENPLVHSGNWNNNDFVPS